MNKYYDTLVQTHRMYNARVNPNVNYGIWVIMMCQCKVINCNKCPPLVQDVDKGGGRVWAEGIWEISVFSAHFCCWPKTALKKQSITNKHTHGHTPSRCRSRERDYLSCAFSPLLVLDGKKFSVHFIFSSLSSLWLVEVFGYTEMRQ